MAQTDLKRELRVWADWAHYKKNCLICRVYKKHPLLLHSGRTRVYFQKFNAFKTIIKVFDKLSIHCLKRLREL